MVAGGAGMVALEIPPLLAHMETPGLAGTPRVIVLRAVPGAALLLSPAVSTAALAALGAGAAWLVFRRGES
jgi:predicted phage tail protein